MSKRILFSSMFKPFGLDDDYGRQGARIELFHNQLTQVQGIFSIRGFVTTAGLHVIANNIETPSTVLDYPTLEQFSHEVKQGYDYIGLSAIQINFNRLQKMVQICRDLAPRSKVIIGGFCSVIPDIQKKLDVDYVCVGEGITFMRRLLSEPPEFEFKNPDGAFSIPREILGVPIWGVRRPQIIVGLGCSYGCDFCLPSHFYKKEHIRFFKTGRGLYDELIRIYKSYLLSVVYFLGDDNFLLDLERAEELRRLLVENRKVVKLFIFASADRVAAFGAERLAEMGVDIIWLGRESKFSEYPKNAGVDFKALVADLRRYGIKPIVSSMPLIDRHTSANIREDIQDHIACDPVFSQFIYYTPQPGTPLFERLQAEGRINTDYPFEDRHGIGHCLTLHPEFTPAQAEEIQQYAYRREYLELGPSLLRFIATEYQGWRNLKNSPRPLLQERARVFARNMWKNQVMLAAIEHLVPTPEMREMARELRHAIESSFGRLNVFEQGLSRGIQAAGQFREFRSRHWGDVMQPPSMVFHYDPKRRNKHR